jgi:hypothetical protein
LPRPLRGGMLRLRSVSRQGLADLWAGGRCACRRHAGDRP